MIKNVVIVAVCLFLSACAQTPEQAAAMQRLSAELLRDPQPVYAPLPASTSWPRTTQCHNVGGTLLCNHR